MHLSIIVPVYNTAIDKLERCFHSIMSFMNASANLDIECLIIDDGSRKSISNWCQYFSNMNSSFRFYKKINEGVSLARNMGISLAKGKYILFVDSDDLLIYCYKIEKYLLKENYDLIFSDLAVDMHQKHMWSAFDGNSREVDIETVTGRLIEDGTLNGPCCKFIRRDFLERYQIYFEKRMITGEDLVFLIQILLSNPRMYYVSECTYIYNLDISTSNSRLKNHSVVFIENNEIMYNKLLELIEECVSNKNQQSFRMKATDRYIKQLFNSVADLFEMNLLTQDIKEQVELLLCHVDRKLVAKIRKRVLSKSSLQLAVLLKNKWLLFIVISRARTIYLKLKNRL
ncbi:glycosyltransferase family 2 protein [Streptococcus ruminantium]|uniref:glycosyltransferase family 2 protein n=1 Tax=Streptococcus ruminantium TaxID=1917441 RepID=UPI001D14BEC0|nr:glycosyltransferase family 2 protein [Streptococcus ruminantium]